MKRNKEYLTVVQSKFNSNIQYGRNCTEMFGNDGGSVEEAHGVLDQIYKEDH